jgi:uncharacterized protein (DUF1684 family)
MFDLQEFRQQKDDFFLNDHHSPLLDEDRAAFKGLKYFHENPKLRFEVDLEPFEEQDLVQIQTNTGEFQEYTRFGKFNFEVEGDSAKLVVYTSGDGSAFVPFQDLTSGKETYGSGRYLDLEHKGGNRYLVDFNLAYNPWCAYSPYYICPLTPEENRLSVSIKAGEKVFS